MNHAFSQMAAMMTAVFVFFFLPFVYTWERNKSVEQMYLLTESIYFVDSVCSTGFLTKEMYDSLYRKINRYEGIYEIELFHETKSYILNEEDTYDVFSEFYDEADILKQLEENDRYLFRKNDFFKIVIRKKEALFWDWYEPSGCIRAYYGGMIRYETY